MTPNHPEPVRCPKCGARPNIERDLARGMYDRTHWSRVVCSTWGCWSGPFVAGARPHEADAAAIVEWIRCLGVRDVGSAAAPEMYEMLYEYVKRSRTICLCGHCRKCRTIAVLAKARGEVGL